MDKLNGAEYGFLLLSSSLGNPGRKPLTVAQMRELFHRSEQMKRRDISVDVNVYDFVSIGYSPKFAQHIVQLLHDEPLLHYYLSKGRKWNCFPITRATESYPTAVRVKLGLDSPGCLWAKGNAALLETPMVSLVGSRDLNDHNRAFAEEVGRQAAFQGYTLVSGNARGADKTAQESCLRAGGKVICVVADSLGKYRRRDSVLYLSEDGFDCEFSSQRALSRNRIIHSLGQVTFVAQSSLHTGGTWDGTAKNLRGGWSHVCCFDDGSEAVQELQQMGASLIDMSALTNIRQLTQQNQALF